MRFHVLNSAGFMHPLQAHELAPGGGWTAPLLALRSIFWEAPHLQQES